MNPYDELLRFIERETELIKAGRWEELIKLEQRRSKLLKILPPNPPPEAQTILSIALTRLQTNAAMLSASLATVRGELDRMGRARTKLGSYSQQPKSTFHIRG
jgi:hypothetical protein